MPIEIRELVIQGSLARKEDQGEASAKVLTEEDISQIRDEVMEAVRSSGGLSAEQRRKFMEEILGEVRKIMDDRWRR